MTKLEQLLKELCPNGVEYKKLGEVATISRGGSFQKKDFCEDGVPCIHYGQIYTRYGLFADKTLTFISEDAAKKQKYAVKNDIVMAVTSENIDDVCKCVAWLGDDEIAVSGHTAIIHHTLNPKYLCYYFHTAMFYAQKKKLAHGTKVIEVTPDKLTDITIPVPPIEIQVEIVKILDEYNTSVIALQQELENELTARKKQYEYYRDLLLDFGVHGGGTSECEWRTIKEIAENCDSKRKPVTKGKRTSGIYPYYGASGIVDYVDDYLFDGDYLLISEDGANLLARSTPIAFSISGKNWVNNHAHVLRFDTYVTRRFVEIYLNSINLEKYISTAAQPKLTQDNLNKIPIPYPTIEEQTRIVNILDRFDKLCNDISEGLPAEIEARRKQYEYYRDKLLSFEEVRI
ncbi:type I restriction enzyme, S subunit [Ruminococcus sp. YE71]|nr:restriction endonuclease subunit S [Ruminococcus sp. YE78]SDA30320.1 type I restriction enzyme, S subunit [Ruminococcus sp. YE78]SFW49420.1 type I restriction enzyme, S subunit [Ruminococcus sp. YE71]